MIKFINYFCFFVLFCFSDKMFSPIYYIHIKLFFNEWFESILSQIIMISDLSFLLFRENVSDSLRRFESGAFRHDWSAVEVLGPEAEQTDWSVSRKSHKNETSRYTLLIWICLRIGNVNFCNFSSSKLDSCNLNSRKFKQSQFIQL